MSIETMWANMAGAWSNIVSGMANLWNWLITPRQILGTPIAPIYILGGVGLTTVLAMIVIKEAIS